jgi:drug/metabolite transporter (DMT)-like permease
MLRGAMVVFSALLSIVFLNRKFYLFNWIGISLVIAALVCVGVSCMNAPSPPGQVEESTSNVVFGIILVVIAQLVQASQIVIEEFLLKSVKADPLLIVGLEGFWGFLITTFICLPIFQHVQWHGFSENSWETLYMLSHNRSILIGVSLYVVVILLYNATAMMVTQQFTAVHRTILEAMRTLCIWMVNIFIYYEVNNSYGEHWTVWSWFEMLGFVILLFGLFIYNEVIQLPWLPDYKTVKQAEHPESIESGRPPPKLPPQSPFATRSPRV